MPAPLGPFSMFRAVERRAKDAGCIIPIFLDARVMLGNKGIERCIVVRRVFAALAAFDGRPTRRNV